MENLSFLSDLSFRARRAGFRGGGRGTARRQVFGESGAGEPGGHRRRGPAQSAAPELPAGTAAPGRRSGDTAKLCHGRGCLYLSCLHLSPYGGELLQVKRKFRENLQCAKYELDAGRRLAESQLSPELVRLLGGGELQEHARQLPEEKESGQLEQHHPPLGEGRESGRGRRVGVLRLNWPNSGELGSQTGPLLVLLCSHLTALRATGQKRHRPRCIWKSKKGALSPIYVCVFEEEN